ncbi:MAG: OmpA family protein [Elusimicrobiaceae bacterium]|nr:OmpA family protein [Elusimicrobiaceae bacterium]
MKRVALLAVSALLLTACQARKAEPGRVGQMYLSTISFAVNGDEIQLSSYKLIDEAVKVYKKNPSVKMEVRGYTDASGNEKKNILLSQKRADKVAKSLQIRGVPAENIAAKGYGSAKPVASNNTPEGRKQNRRVEIEFPYPGN